MSVPNGKAPIVMERFRAGDYLGVAEVIIPNERLATEIMMTTVNWDSRVTSHFDIPLALEDVWYTGNVGQADFTVLKATFKIGGDDEASLEVTKNNLAFVQSDEWSSDMLRSFTEIYSTHAHLLCLRSLRAQRQAYLDKRKDQQRNTDKKDRSFKVKLNGVIIEDI